MHSDLNDKVTIRPGLGDCWGEAMLLKSLPGL